MKLNIIAVINEIDNEMASDKFLNEYYADQKLHWQHLYNMEMHFIRMHNQQTWDMIHFYESRYGLDYVNTHVHVNLVEEPTFEEWYANKQTLLVF